MSEEYDVLIVGAGPTGLSCGIEALRAGLRSVIVEKGCLVNSLFHYPANMTFFTTRERLEIGGVPFASINLKPTRAEALEYYRRVAEMFRLPVCYEREVTAIRRSGSGFEVEVKTRDQKAHSYSASYVVVATGYYDRPNLLHVPGENLPKVSHYALEGHAFYGRKVAVIGGANSAAITALDLYRHGARVSLICRRGELSRHIKYWIRPDLENRIREGSIEAHFECEVSQIREDSIEVRQGPRETFRLENDFVFALTGYHPDVELLRAAGVFVDPTSLRPASNGRTYESNVPNLYLAGVVISGRATNEVFIENGRFHGRHIIADIQRKRKREAAAAALPEVVTTGP